MNIANVIIWMRKQAYEDSTTRKVAKILRHLKRNCNTVDPEEVKLYTANKECTDGHKQIDEDRNRRTKQTNIKLNFGFTRLKTD